jgi:putative hydrolase of the HAD superfamily
MTELDLDRIRVLLFDFYGTLAQAYTFDWEVGAGVVLDSLRGSGLDLEAEAFLPAYRASVDRFQKRMIQDGRETHNTAWVADTLTTLGHPAEPGDPHVVAAVDAYFDRYSGEIEPYPDVEEGLSRLGERYRLGLLSNFTDPRPVRRTLRRTGLEGCFQEVVVSAEVGVRKPWPEIFRITLERMGAAAGETMHVGDHPVADVDGARRHGMITARLTRPDVPVDWYQPYPRDLPYDEADVVARDLLELIEKLPG